ncbi:MAG: hypothetical protein KDD50_12475, partial [Bdellovibrionales bacterium]|nr:hypothetical protein [Bdellovibrionales bacterium]
NFVSLSAFNFNDKKLKNAQELIFLQGMMSTFSMKNFGKFITLDRKVHSALVRMESEKLRMKQTQQMECS